MIIRILAFEGCPNCNAANDLAEQAVSELHVQAEIECMHVNSETEAEQYHFRGSPTIQVNGGYAEERPTVHAFVSTKRDP